MRALLGLVRPQQGELRILGIDAEHAGVRLHRRIGYMPEHDCLPTAMTARDLVVHLAELRGLPRRAAVLRASEVLFQVGLDEERSRTIRTYSTGMKQRAKLAQALVHRAWSAGRPSTSRRTASTRLRARGDADARAAPVADLGIPRAAVVARARGRRAHLRRGRAHARRQRSSARARSQRSPAATRSGCGCASAGTRRPSPSGSPRAA